MDIRIAADGAALENLFQNTMVKGNDIDISFADIFRMWLAYRNTGLTPERCAVLVDAERNGRMIILDKCLAKSRYEAADYLLDWVHEAEFEDLSAGMCGINSDIGDILKSLVDVLNVGRTEAEAALKEQEKQR